MDKKEVETLIQKIRDGQTTPEEELKVLKFLNQTVKDLRSFIQQIKTKNKAI